MPELPFLVISAIIFTIIGIQLSQAGIFHPVKDLFTYLWYLVFTPYIHPEVPEILTNHFEYYRNLNPENKKRFEQRLVLFLKGKKIIAHNHLLPTNKMKVLVAASATQITFGLPYYRLKYFQVIHLYPNVYSHRQFKNHKLRGHVSDHQSIHLSWNYFEKGYLFPNDGINLGIHEMMHALKLHAMQEEVDFKFYDNHKTWVALAKIELDNIKHNKEHFLRNYGGQNLDELLAVCAEVFFELPGELKKKLPKVFDAMTKLLNQNPLNAATPVIAPY